MFEDIRPFGTRPFGIHGVDLHPGDHLCAVHKGPDERDEVLVPYYIAGLRAGDKCVVVLDRADSSTFLSALGDDQLVTTSLESGQLGIRTIGDAPALPAGAFSPDDLCMFWDAVMATEFDSGEYTFGRLGGEAGWWLHHLPNPAELVHYESALNRCISGRPQSALCTYDLERFGEGIIVDIVMTHPNVLVHDRLVDNPYYLDPKEFALIRRAPDATHLGEEIRGWYDEVSAS